MQIIQRLGLLGRTGIRPPNVRVFDPPGPPPGMGLPPMGQPGAYPSAYPQQSSAPYPPPMPTAGGQYGLPRTSAPAYGAPDNGAAAYGAPGAYGAPPPHFSSVSTPPPEAHAPRDSFIRCNSGAPAPASGLSSSASMSQRNGGQVIGRILWHGSAVI